MAKFKGKFVPDSHTNFDSLDRMLEHCFNIRTSGGCQGVYCSDCLFDTDSVDVDINRFLEWEEQLNSKEGD